MNPIENRIFKLEIMNYRLKNRENQLKKLKKWHDTVTFYLTFHKKCDRIEQVRSCELILSEIKPVFDTLAYEANLIIQKAANI